MKQGRFLDLGLGRKFVKLVRKRLHGQEGTWFSVVIWGLRKGDTNYHPERERGLGNRKTTGEIKVCKTKKDALDWATNSFTSKREKKKSGSHAGKKRIGNT